MILRKPYAFFIKNFKLLHIILTVLIAYLIYRTGLSLTFFNEYISTNKSVIDQDLTGALFNIYMFIIPFIIIIADIVILSVMYVKKKPILFYVTIIIIYALMLLVYNYVYSTLGLMESQLLDIRTVRMARDLLTMALIVQVLSVIITFVRATGFDIKKFNFGQDLAELKINEEDREEFEVEVNVDTGKVQRKIRRNWRFARYVYEENKFLIHIVVLILIATSCFVVYLNLSVYNKIYNENEAFLATDFSIRITKSFITTEDYKGNQIVDDGKSLVLVEIDLKNNFTKMQKLEIARTQLIANGKKYYPQYKFRERLFDLGKVYDDDLLPNKFTRHLLVYEVPTVMIENKNLQFKYSDKVDYTGGKLSPKYITVNLKPRQLDKLKETKEFKLGNEISFEKSILGNTKLVINKYGVADQFKIDYQFCVVSEECYASYEYLRPDIVNRFDKTLLYLNGNIVWDDELPVDSITDLYNFVNLFGTIVYEINGEVRTQTVSLKEVRSLKTDIANDYYIEVLKEVKKADKITLVFNIRDMEYKYVIK